MVKLTPTGVEINTNLVWTSHNIGGVEFNTGVFAVLFDRTPDKLRHSGTNKLMKYKPFADSINTCPDGLKLW